MTPFLRSIFALFLLLAPTGSLAATPLPMPTGDVLLTVEGEIGRTNDGQRALFDREMLRNLGETSFETTTIWTDGPQRFTGVPLSAVMEALGVNSGTLRAYAINDYAVELPLGAPGEPEPLIAYAQNGAPMSVRENGPLWLVYPYDSDPALQTELIYSRSIWQLDRIEVTR